MIRYANEEDFLMVRKYDKHIRETELVAAVKAKCRGNRWKLL